MVPATPSSPNKPSASDRFACQANTPFAAEEWKSMHAELYTDGIEEITVNGTIVRVDLVSLSPTERDANNQPKKVLCQRLIFSVEAFANSVEVMQSALRGLVEAGVVARAHPRLATTTSERDDNLVAPAVSSDSRPPNVSPNFR